MFPNQVIKYPYVLLDDTDAYKLEIQLVQPRHGVLMTFCHIHVKSWSKATMRSLEEMWKRVRPTLPDIVFAQGKVSDSKWEKFVTHFGFKPASNAVCLDGQVRRIFYNGNNGRQSNHIEH